MTSPRLLPTLPLLAALLSPGIFPLQAQTPPRLSPDAPAPNIAFADFGIPDIVPYIEDLTGKNILIPQALPAVRFNFTPSHPMSVEEQLIALESLFALNGLTLIEINPRLLKIVPSAQAALNAPELISGPLAPLPGSERIVSKLFRLQYVTTENALAVIQPLLSQAAAINEPRHDWLLLTDQLAHLKRIELLLNEIDQPSTRRETVRFYDLRFAPASSVSERIDNLAQGVLRNRLGGAFTLSVDQRSNRLIIATHPDNFELFERLIAELDVDAAPLTRSEVFYIKHAVAGDVVEVIKTIIDGQRTASEEVQAPTTGRPPPADPQNTDSPLPDPVATPLTAEGPTGASLQFSPFITLADDERSNSIVVYGNNADIQQIAELIDKIDVLLSQVRLEVIITEVTLTEGMVRGLDAFGLAYNLEDSNEITLSPTGPPLRLGGILIDTLTAKDFSINAIFNTAKSNGNVKVISSPTILTTHNREAYIDVNQEIPVVTGTFTSTEGTSTRSNIDRIPVGIRLEVKPLVAPNGIIQLEIKQTVDNIVSVISNSDNPDLNGQPLIGKRETESFVSVRDQDIIVLGGLQETSESLVENRLALFGRLPILGEALFTRKERDISTRELVIFIKPTVLFTAEDAALDARRILSTVESSERITSFIENAHLRPLPLDRIEDWKKVPDPTEARVAPVRKRTTPRMPQR
ncbi:MAG: secretin N-terminal domain-containing protein [Puniceicoccaceae bacterium]